MTMFPIATIPAEPYPGGFDRYSRPDYMQGINLPWIIVPRRGWNAQTVSYFQQVAQNPVEGLRRWAQELPLRLLEILGDVHPTFSMARSNWLNLAFGPDDTDFVAEDASGKTNKRGTKAIADLFASMKSDVNGAVTLQRAIGQQILFFGMTCIEGVPNKNGAGLETIVTFDPLSTRFRDLSDGSRIFEQRQGGQWKELKLEQCFSFGYDSSSDNPYGRPLFSGALGEGLSDLERQKNSNDVLRTVVWPRLSVGFPHEAVMKLALENPSLTIGRGPNGEDLSPSQYAAQQFNAFQKMMMGLKADDIFIYPMGGQVDSINAAQGLDGIAKILEQKRIFLCQGLDTLPSLCGVTDGGTQAYSSVQWGVQVKKIEGFRSFVNGCICRVLDFMLRLLGLNVKSVAKTKPIRSSEQLADAQARQYEIANEQALIDMGFNDRDTACVELTGHEPVLDDEAYQAQQDEQAQKELDSQVQLATAGKQASNTVGDKKS